ncbi:hypothetical protein ACWEWI_26225 [Streptomyces sp. NPDC003753]
MRDELRESAPCGLAEVPDDAIAVEYTVDETGYSYRAAASCAAPGCVAYVRDARWVAPCTDGSTPAPATWPRIRWSGLSSSSRACTGGRRGIRSRNGWSG